MQTKTCKTCLIDQPIDHFYLSKRHTDGRVKVCRNCQKIKMSEYREKHRAKIKRYMHGYFSENKKRILAQTRKFRKENPEIVKERREKYYAKYREKLLAQNKEYYQKNKDKKKQYDRKYRLKAKNRKRRNALEQAQNHASPIRRIKKALRNAVRLGMLGKIQKSMHTDQYLGCSFEFFCKHMELQFLEGMTFENYGKAWHIDHIKPINTFPVERLGEAFHYTNCRPLWASENYGRPKDGSDLCYLI